MVQDRAVPCTRRQCWYDHTMSTLPVAIRRRLRSSGFSEEQTDALEEASDATRQGLAQQTDVDSKFGVLQAEFAALRAEMQALKWWLFGALSTVILAATAAMIAAFVAWG